MKRLTPLLLMLVLFTAAVAANAPQGPIRDVTVVDGVDDEYTAGAMDTVIMQFANYARKPLPVYVTVTASSSEGIHGGEFAVGATLWSANSQDTTNASLECTLAWKVNTSGTYLCRSDDRPILPRTTEPSQNTLYTSITSALNTAPGDYHFDVELYSAIGIPATKPVKRPTTPGKTTQIAFDHGTVVLHTPTAVNVTVQPYDSLVIPVPNRKLFVAGAGIDAGHNGVDAPVNGTIRFDLDATQEQPEALTVYKRNGTASDWQKLDTTVNRKKGHVTAAVDGSATYAVFADDQASDETGEKPDDSGKQGTDGDPGRSNYENTETRTRICIQDDWSCTQWTSCQDDIQTRRCEKTTACRNGYAPDTYRSCIAPNDTTPANESAADEPNDIVSGLNNTATNNTLSGEAGQQGQGNVFTGALSQERQRWLGAGIAAVLLFVGVYYWRRELVDRLTSDP